MEKIERFIDCKEFAGETNGESRETIIKNAEAKSNPAITFIIPFYNSERYFDRCLASVGGQTLRNTEILLIDDRGTDGSRAIADKWAVRDSRVRIIKNERNIGAGLSRNVGIAAAQGDYIAFVDADDYIAPDWAEVILATEINTGADISVGRAVSVWPDGTTEEFLSSATYALVLTSEVYAVDDDVRPAEKLLSFSCWGCLFKRGTLEGKSFLDLCSGEDTEFMFRAFYDAKRAAKDPRAVYFYQQHIENVAESDQLKQKTIARAESQLNAAHEILNRFAVQRAVLEGQGNNAPVVWSKNDEWRKLAERQLVEGTFAPMFNALVFPDAEPIFRKYKLALSQINPGKNDIFFKKELQVLRFANLAETGVEFVRLCANGITDNIFINNDSTGFLLNFNINRVQNSYGKTITKISAFDKLIKWLRKRFGDPFRHKSGGGEVKPESVRLDICTLCNLDCLTCRMRKNNFCNRGAGYTSFQNFEKFLNKNPFVKNIEISSWGEPFMNPDIIPIIELARSRGVKITISHGTNFNAVNDKILYALVLNEIEYINIAIDGASPEVYGAYRRGGDFNKVIENIKKLNTIKAAFGKEIPKLNWQYVILPTNASVDEIRRAKTMAAELGMSTTFVRDWDNFIPADASAIERETGVGFDSIHYKRHSLPAAKGERHKYCPRLWNNPQFNWDGRFVACGENTWGEFCGNAITDGIVACLDGEVFRATQKMLCGTGAEVPDSPCAKCWMYLEMKESGKFLTEDELCGGFLTRK
ncbi:MAG: glycosyltransferase [Rickettsiales bacterium]|jgi:glycosyltransferase involved in cell wall biosynthesis/MoaA/NifB/PqqE/SkfB family radical SAM enzyme|nr:glycosyltransferase [Rickettsiales bacterium]